MTSNPNMKTVCDNCSAQYIVKHDLPEDDYIEQFCPFCGGHSLPQREEAEKAVSLAGPIVMLTTPWHSA